MRKGFDVVQTDQEEMLELRGVAWAQRLLSDAQARSRSITSRLRSRSSRRAVHEEARGGPHRRKHSAIVLDSRSASTRPPSVSTRRADGGAQRTRPGPQQGSWATREAVHSGRMARRARGQSGRATPWATRQRRRRAATPSPLSDGVVALNTGLLRLPFSSDHPKPH